MVTGQIDTCISERLPPTEPELQRSVKVLMVLEML